MWFMALETPTLEQSGLISIVVGAGAAWFGLYVNSTSSKHTSVPEATGSMPKVNTSRKTVVEDDYDEYDDDLPAPARRM